VISLDLALCHRVVSPAADVSLPSCLSWVDAAIPSAFARHFHRTVPAQFRQNAADGARLDTRDQARCSYRNGPRATLCAFDLIELDEEDLRWQPIEDRKAALKKLLHRSHPGIAFNKHFDVEGAVVFHHACKLGCEGIVSKRLGLPYRFGRSADWIKVKNPAAPAVKREAEEEWR
jgi:ATP dependent DNA ligase domain